MAEPVKNEAFSFYLSLIDSSNRPNFKSAPTLAAGDFQVSTDGATFANLATLPTVSPSGGSAVKVSLSAAEMSGSDIVVQCSDVTGAEWDDVMVAIQTTSSSLDSIKDDLSDLSGSLGNVEDDVNTILNTIGTLETDVTFIKDIEGGRWIIDESVNQMVFYKSDNSTEVARFDLKDIDGNATSTDVFERTRA